VEIDRPGPSYTVDTIEALRARLGSDVRIYFITGADAVMELMTWNRPDAILEMCELIAATRPGYPPADIQRLRQAVPEANAKRVHTIEVPALAISSSDIRARVAQGKPIKYLVPETVEHYILKSGLYGGPLATGRAGAGPLSGFYR
jgi:nicotinate-nucleotide adenylyltransferase